MNPLQRPIKVIILGATGSIGTQTIACINDANLKVPGTFMVMGMSAHHNHKALREAARNHPTALLALTNAPKQHDFITFSGQDASSKLIESCEADIVVNGIAGSKGLEASLTTVSRGMRLALANKESVVMGWHLIRNIASISGAEILPVDSEHAALFQLISRIGKESIRELTITASGGPFRNMPIEKLSSVTADDAATHPTWKMGRKISIDSASLANKGLELIEAVRLFDMDVDQVKVLIHPESIVHALVRTKDASLYSQMSSPDMRLPIHAALFWPEEVESSYGLLDLAGRTLHFDTPDLVRFPMLQLARHAVAEGQGATVAYNAANEVAVDAFDSGKIGFTSLSEVVESTLSADWSIPLPSLGSILEADARARRLATEKILEM